MVSQVIGNGVFEYLPDLKQFSVPESRTQLGSRSQIIPLKFSVKMNRYTILLIIAVTVLVLILVL